jgi:hypothetical protein
MEKTLITSLVAPRRLRLRAGGVICTEGVAHSGTAAGKSIPNRELHSLAHKVLRYTALKKHKNTFEGHALLCRQTQSK